MPKRITDEEIAELQLITKSLMCLSSRVIPTYKVSQIGAALDRLAGLESAVGFKNFDDLPVSRQGLCCVTIEVKYPEGDIIRFSYSTRTGLSKILNISKPGYTIGAMKRNKFRWRYPVGDLSQ